MNNEKNAQICARKKTSIGGQALMEGIMMRGPKKTAMAVRNPQGEIILEEVEVSAKKRPAICRWPFIRGIFGYIDSMTLGYKCLMRSAEIAGLEDMVEESPSKKKKREEREARARKTETEDTGAVTEAESAPMELPAEEPIASEDAVPTENPKAEASEQLCREEEKLPAWVMTLTMVLSVVVGVCAAIALILLLPTFLFNLLAKPFPVLKATGNIFLDSIIKSAFEGVIRIVLLVGYMALISLMKDIRRTFMFHGAEHKSIFCYEAGLELNVENVRAQRRFHPRCGTSFLILMVLVSIFISFFIDPITVLISGATLPTGWRYVVKFLLIPLIVGAGYELIKLAGRHDNLFTRIISAPGVWLQHLTVLEPTDDMIECAIVALKEVIPDDDSDRW